MSDNIEIQVLSDVSHNYRRKRDMIDDKCPHCGADLKGDEIPEQHRESFGGYTHFSRHISIYDMDKDRTTHYQCPDCQRMWGRK